MMIFLLLGMLQSGATAPDIQFNAIIHAQSLRIEKHGRASLEVHADPDAGSLVNVDAPKANGAKTLRNVRITVAAEARIGSGGPSNAVIEKNPPQATEVQTQR